ncbi:MAG: sulfite exporter TauE/SafE family protein [Christensenellaceae bacterium]|jgi:uncharacterized membrane protein YfcA|nr:sulfite exporter TauE/SafE family protein [Christensenellaceae bacterium]
MVYIILVAASFIAAFVSGAAGFGGALLLLPVVTACVGAQVAVPVLTIAQLMGNLSRMAFGWKQIDWKPVGLFCTTALPAAALGAFGFALLPKGLVTRCIGAALIALVLFKIIKRAEFRAGDKTMLLGGAVVGLLSGLAGSGGPIGAAVFLSLGLPPVAYIASEAATATALHILKTVIYSQLVNINGAAILTGLIMGLAMIGGTFCANKIIQNMEKGKFQNYVAALLLLVGLYMLGFGA